MKKINSIDLRILAGSFVIETNLKKESKRQLLKFIQHEASDYQIMTLLLDGVIVKLDEHSEQITKDRFECSKLYNSLVRFQEQDVKIPVTHPGMLEVPDGKDVEDLPFSHFQGLVKKKGLAPISKALTNLIVWNKKKNPTLSNKVDAIQNKLTAWAEKEREAGKEIK